MIDILCGWKGNNEEVIIYLMTRLICDYGKHLWSLFC